MTGSRSSAVFSEAPDWPARLLHSYSGAGRSPDRETQRERERHTERKSERERVRYRGPSGTLTLKGLFNSKKINKHVSLYSNCQFTIVTINAIN